MAFRVFGHDAPGHPVRLAALSSLGNPGARRAGQRFWIRSGGRAQGSTGGLGDRTRPNPRLVSTGRRTHDALSPLARPISYCATCDIHCGDCRSEVRLWTRHKRKWLGLAAVVALLASVHAGIRWRAHVTPPPVAVVDHQLERTPGGPLR